jgi:DNA-binding MarR family transcriptional regulator
MYSYGVASAVQPTIGYLVWRLSMKWCRALDVAVGPLGLTHAQYAVLASLRGMARSGGVHPNQRELSDHTGLDPIYISRLVRAMEDSGLIRRVPDDHDLRAVRLTLTKRGTHTADEAITQVGRLLEELTEPLGGISSQSVQELATQLQALIAHPFTDTKKRSKAKKEAA